MVTKNKTRKFRSVIMTAAAILAIGGAMAKNYQGFISNNADVTYHITGVDEDGNYIVSTSGRCLSGNNDCQFTTSLSPDQGNNFSPDYLQSNNVTIEKGSYSAN